MDIAGIAPGTVIGRFWIPMRKHQRVKENGSADVSAVQNVMFCNEV